MFDVVMLKTQHAIHPTVLGVLVTECFNILSKSWLKQNTKQFYTM